MLIKSIPTAQSLGVKFKDSLAKPTTRKTAAFVSGGALALGLIVGSGMSGASSATEITQLEATIESAEGASEELSTELEQLEILNERLDKALDLKAETITTLRSEAATAAASATTQAARITELETAVAVAVAAAAPPPVPVAAPAPAPAPEAPASNTYYQNCTAVRAAGADPIRQGDPGYGRHLDRDGDGVGCE